MKGLYKEKGKKPPKFTHGAKPVKSGKKGLISPQLAPTSIKGK